MYRLCIIIDNIGYVTFGVPLRWYGFAYISKISLFPPEDQRLPRLFSHFLFRLLSSNKRLTAIYTSSSLLQTGSAQLKILAYCLIKSSTFVSWKTALLPSAVTTNSDSY